MDKKLRLQKIKDLLSEGEIVNQEQIRAALQQEGIEVNQGTLSRDLRELSVLKVEGVYRVPSFGGSKAAFGGSIDFRAAGDNILVAKVNPGQAMSLAAMIDDLALREIVGTIAGDDTIMIATQSRVDQDKIVSAVVARL